MESLYYVMTWLCHRTCEHCYEDRFHPYHGEDLRRVVQQSEQNFAKIIDHLPSRMTFRDTAEPELDRVGTVILAGGEILLDAVRETVLYPAIARIQNRYRDCGGVRLVVQTTGDILTPAIAAELTGLGVWMVSVSGIDAFHQGLETEAARERMKQRIAGTLEAAGFTYAPITYEARSLNPEERFYHFFGATPDTWIGSLWPRGRAFENSLSTATIADSFCNRWSGGLKFLELGSAGSEVSIDPEGNVFPCCVKTRVPVGNLLAEPLEDILRRLRGNPVYEAINAGAPERMGLAHGWSEKQFREKSRTTLPNGQVYENLCIGCDRFHQEFLMPQSALVEFPAVRS